MSYKKVLSYGTLNPDLMYFVDEIPPVGGDIRSKEYKIRPGGTAINCAENIKNWGIETSVMGNCIGKDPLGDYLLSYLKESKIGYKDVLINDCLTPTCSIYIDKNGERTIISSGYENCNWNNLNKVKEFDSMIIDRYSIKYIRENLKNEDFSNVFITQAGYGETIDYKIDFLVVSKDEIDVIEANRLLNEDFVSWILLTSANLPARLLSKDGVVEITPPDFKTINSTGAGDVTAAYIGAHGIDDVITTTRNACAAGAIVAGTSSLPSIEKIEEISKLVEIKPR
jgi:sugar/nucleoside kinase (ribokinase family)|tara:strand:- start:105 stop:953 length:849 start_codon:yes stop_codon:yes gene_type:complete